MNNKLTEERLLDLIDGSGLVMGGHRDRDVDRGFDRSKEREKDRERSRESDQISLPIEEEVDLTGETFDLYSNNVVFDE